jgi:tol-pal system protein YbgF
MTPKVRCSTFKPLLRRTCLALVVIAAGGVLQPVVVQPVLAQSVDDQLQRMQRELSDLQRQVYGGAAPAAGAASSGGGDLAPTQAARFQLQLEELQIQIQRLTGRIEDMTFRLDEVTARLDKLVADVDLRLRNLEEGGLPPVGATAPLAADATAPLPAASAEAAAPLGAGATAPTPGTLGTISETDLNDFQREQASTEALAAQQSAPAPATAAQTAALPGDTPQAQYDYAFGLLRQANYAAAEQAFSSFLVQNPSHGLAGNAKYWLGETFYVRGNYQQAAVTFAEGFEAYPTNSKAPDNLLKLGMSLASLGSTQDACGTFDVLLDRYADAPATILSRAQREAQRLGCP